jgi:hypothetical protein
MEDGNLDAIESGFFDAQQVIETIAAESHGPVQGIGPTLVLVAHFIAPLYRHSCRVARWSESASESA